VKRDIKFPKNNKEKFYLKMNKESEKIDKEDFEIIKSKCIPISQKLRKKCTIQTGTVKDTAHFLHFPFDKVLSDEIPVTILE